MDSAHLLEEFDTVIATPEDVAELEAAILDMAVRGQLVPQDPTDEPASALLERIKAEKERLIETGEIRRFRQLPPLDAAEIPYEIPDNWTWCRLPYVYRNWGQGEPESRFTYVDVSSVDNERGVIGEELAIIDPEEAPSRARKHVRRGTVIYGTVRPYLLNIAIVDRDFDPPPIVSTAFEVMHALEGVFNRYLYYYLRSKPFIDFVESQMVGMAYPAISKTKLYKGLFPLPPLAEQKRIVARVDELLAQTRELATHLEQAQAVRVPAAQATFQALTEAPDLSARREAWQRIADGFDALTATPETIDAMRQTVLQLAVQGQLVPQDPADEPADILVEEIESEKKRLVREGKARRRKKLPPLSNEEIPSDPPDGWIWIKLDEITEVASGVTKGRDFRGKETITLPYLRVANVQRGYLDLSEIKEIEIKVEEMEKYLLEDGDLLLTEGGDADKLGRSAIWREQIPYCIHQNHIFRARVYLPDLSVKWIMLCTNSHYGRQYFLGSAKQTTNLASINMTQLRNFPVALPPLTEQRRIVAKVEELLALCDGLAEAVAAGEAVRGRLLQAVLNGSNATPIL